MAQTSRSNPAIGGAVPTQWEVTPSAQDRVITADLHRAAKLLEIDMLDHVIIGSEGFASLKEEGCLPD